MNEVIAVEPRAFKDAREFLGFMSQFGFHQGRFIGSYPMKWIRQVIKHLDANTSDPLERAIAIEHLKREITCRNRILDLSVPLNQSPEAWIEIALQGKIDGIFQDVIAERGNSSGFQSFPIPPDYFDKFPRNQRVLSGAEGYGEVAKILLSTSYEIAIFDPFLSKGRDTWRVVLEKFASIAASGGICEQFNIFTLEDRTDSPQAIQRWAKAFYQNVRRHVNVTHYVLRDEGNIDADDHPRYLISIKGALNFDRGFEADSPPRKRLVSVVDRALHEELCKQFLEDVDKCLPFKIVEQPIVLGRTT